MVIAPLCQYFTSGSVHVIIDWVRIGWALGTRHQGEHSQYVSAYRRCIIRLDQLVSQSL